MNNIDTKIREANGRLKESHAKISIERDGNMLRLRGTFPPRDGSSDEKRKRQRIPLGLPATVEGVREAEIEALAIRRELIRGIFSWDKYLTSEKEQALNYKTIEKKTIEKWVNEFEENYFKEREKTDKSMTTWKTNYLAVFRHLPHSFPLEEGILRENIIERTKPDTRNRKRYVLALGALAKFANLETSFTNLSGKYSLASLNPRNIPEDETIVKIYRDLENPCWRWIFGILATYGLRNHEVFRLDFENLRRGSTIISVLAGKTGARKTWPIYPEWFEEFNLVAVKIPPLNYNRTNASLGTYVSRFFISCKIPFSPYALRHAWAIRSLEFGLNPTLAAQQMGHSLKIHTQIYHHWLSEQHHQKAYDLLLNRQDRPKAPR
jgi:integrase